jgi:ParB family protein of integrating conjugative element (PFGI_1 class)
VSRVSLDERRRQVADALHVGNPGNNARDLTAKAELCTESQIELTIDEIRPYENNPRRAVNAKFEDIKESIRTGGLRSPLTVTQRPGESHFIVEAGGNTRLLALRQLWAETRDPRFRKLAVLFRPWRSESHVLTAHLIENEQRGEMTFWDKASGVVALKSRIEAEQGRVLALRTLEDALHALGLSVNTATLGLQLFASERLHTLGEAVADLSGLDVKMIQPRLNALKRYAQARMSITEDELYAQVFEPVFLRIAEEYPRTGAFSVAATCQACELALAAHLGEPVEVLREALGTGEARSAQSDIQGPASGTREVSDVSTGRPAGDETPAVTDGEADELLSRARGFADAVGLGEVVRPEPQSVAGLRLSSLSAEHAVHPERARAWWLLAGLLDQLQPDASPPDMPVPSFVRWLVDPKDPSAAALWELLACARRSGRLCHEPRAVTRSTPAPEIA